MPTPDNPPTDGPQHVTLDLDVPLARLNRSLQIIMDRVAVALRALEDYSASPRELPMLPAGVPLAVGVGLDARVPDAPIAMQLSSPLPFAAACNESRRWILTNGIKDVITVLNLFLDAVRAIAAFLEHYAAGQPFRAGEAMRSASHDSPAAKNFHKKGLPHKYNELFTDLGVPCMDDLRNLCDCLLSINAARNCLEHRGGIVSDADLKSGERELSVKWVTAEFAVRGPDGSETPAKTGGFIDAPHGITFRQRAPRQRTFGLGSRVNFDVDAFSEICWTLGQFGVLLVAALAEKASARGMPRTTP